MKRGENAADAGRTLAHKRGGDYMREIGRRGGRIGGAKNAAKGSSYMRGLALKAVETITPEQRRKNGRKGGLAARGKSGRRKAEVNEKDAR